MDRLGIRDERMRQASEISSQCEANPSFRAIAGK
jgi:hypothetical protein